MFRGVVHVDPVDQVFLDAVTTEIGILLLDVRNGLIEIESRSIRPDKPALRGIEMHVLHQITERVKGTLEEHSDTCKSSCNSAYYLKYALGIISGATRSEVMASLRTADGSEPCRK